MKNVSSVVQYFAKEDNVANNKNIHGNIGLRLMSYEGRFLQTVVGTVSLQPFVALQPCTGNKIRSDNKVEQKSRTISAYYSRTCDAVIGKKLRFFG